MPAAPRSSTTFKAVWSWDDVDQAFFTRLLRNHGVWSERNASVNGPNATLWTLLEVHSRQFGKIVVRGVSTEENAVGQLDDHIRALSADLQPPVGLELTRMGWLEFALNPFPDLFTMPPGGVSSKVKDALLKKRLSDAQIGVAHQYLTEHDVMGGMLGLATYGGRINTLAPDATAASQRSSILDLACTTGWLDPADEAENLRWVRAFYRDLFADSGGVPAPGAAYDGTFINHPDTDLVDPTLNTSKVPWSTLYYGANYPRLQKNKARWDPRNVFRHALSIRAEQ